MHHPQHPEIKKLAGADDSVFRPLHVALFDDRHWSYIQRRYRMTPRELQVARLICQGFNNGEITGTLKIKPGTVKTHLRNIYRKIRVRNKIEMLLTFLNDANKFFAKSGITPPIPVAEFQNPTQTAPATPRTPQER